MSSALQAMDKARLLAVLKQSKKRMEKGNEDFVKAIDERIQHETKFRSAIRSLEQATTSTLDVLTLHEELEPSEKDAQSIINLKKEVKLVADMQLKLSKEVNLSRKRKQKLEEISREFKRILGNETRETVIEIMDSPPRENVNDTSSHPKNFYCISERTEDINCGADSTKQSTNTTDGNRLSNVETKGQQYVSNEEQYRITSNKGCSKPIAYNPMTEPTDEIN
ncbi:uncharacterized protein LOC116342926 isoform X1 [Contarinia nasturtii]|uniref:uncharacterized protein LOC116342926 isoform X1 n=1 Tax=Contarinia nasturtii TaxID=265458 RepID=UPI0012D4680C|nr:uncharacterized protein LOC116342926 isoform X1 [Contarinia nasturtii]